MSDNIKTWLRNHYGFLLCGIVAIIIALITICVHLRFWSLETVGSDTYYSWVEGGRILRERNPYERILHGSMDENNKYATYFPLFYEVSAVTQYFGLEYYPKWIAFWRYVFMFCNISIGLTIFSILYSRRTWALALLALPFWYFNRWTLNVSSSAALDFIPILFMILSLSLFDKSRKISLLLFGFSLAFKQIAIFLTPLFLIWEYQDSKSLKRTVVAGLLITFIPLFASIPFLLWNAEGFVKSIAFSATRIAQNHFGAESLDTLLGLSGLTARIPFLLMLFGAYISTFQKSMMRYGSAMLVMGSFIAFNSILFAHYPAWFMPLLPLAAGEWAKNEIGLKRLSIE